MGGTRRGGGGTGQTTAQEPERRAKARGYSGKAVRGPGGQPPLQLGEGADVQAVPSTPRALNNRRQRQAPSKAEAASSLAVEAVQEAGVGRGRFGHEPNHMHTPPGPQDEKFAEWRKKLLEHWEANDFKQFGRVLNSARKASGTTLATFATAIQARGEAADQTALSRLERGKRGCSRGQLAAILAVLDARTAPHTALPEPATDANPLLVEIGARIRRLRTEQGLTLSELVTKIRELGEAADVSSLSEIENGKGTANITKLLSVAGGLGIGIEALVGTTLPTRGLETRDQAEVALLNAFRGAGVSGVALWIANQIESGELHSKPAK